MTYLVPIALYSIAIIFGVFWIWICGGFEKCEVRWRKHFFVFKTRALGTTELLMKNMNMLKFTGGNLYEGPGSRRNDMQDYVV